MSIEATAKAVQSGEKLASNILKSSGLIGLLLAVLIVSNIVTDYVKESARATQQKLDNEQKSQELTLQRAYISSQTEATSALLAATSELSSRTEMLVAGMQTERSFEEEVNSDHAETDQRIAALDAKVSEVVIAIPTILAGVDQNQRTTALMITLLESLVKNREAVLNEPPP